MIKQKFKKLAERVKGDFFHYTDEYLSPVKRPKTLSEYQGLTSIVRGRCPVTGECLETDDIVLIPVMNDDLYDDNIKRTFRRDTCYKVSWKALQENSYEDIASKVWEEASKDLSLRKKDMYSVDEMLDMKDDWECLPRKGGVVSKLSDHVKTSPGKGYHKK